MNNKSWSIYLTGLLCWNIFIGIILISIDKGKNVLVTICWLLVNVTTAVLFSYHYTYRKLNIKYEAYQNVRNDYTVDNAVIPILGQIPHNTIILAQNIFDHSAKKSVNVLSLPSLYEGHEGNETTFIFRLLMVIEHEVFHGISSRENLGIDELSLNCLQKYLIENVPFHWSAEMAKDAFITIKWAVGMI